MPTTALIADALRDLARWRRARFDEPDRDRRHLQSAAGLDALAAWIESLPEDDARVHRLRELAVRGDRFEPGQQTHFAMARFHFHQTETTFDGFLSHLLELQERDTREDGHFGGRMADGDDPWAAPRP